jgi:hypothetical protein
MSEHAVSFENEQIGATPEGWTATLAGKGNSKLTVESDETAPSKMKVLRQSGRATTAASEERHRYQGWVH